MTRISVPIFFYISGFLLFYNFKSLSYSWYISKLKKRCITLLIPFLIWSIYGFVVVYSIKFVLPSAFNSYQPLKNYEVIDFLQAFFWTPVGCYQLWFIRDLFLCIILSPILYIGLRYLKEFFLILLFLFWFLGIYYVISIDSLLFITLGAYMALNHKSYMEKVISKKPILLLGFFWVFFCILDYNFPFFNILHGIAILLGGVFLWGLYDVVDARTLGRFRNCDIYRYTFFIFVFHEPILTLVKGVLLRIFISQTGIFVIYFIAPILVIGICVICARWINSNFSHMFRIICGGRGV